MGRNLKILLLGDYSNCHRTLALGLQRLGCDVTVASDGTQWQNCYRDIDLTRRKGKIGGLLQYLQMSTVLRSRLKGYDIVALNEPNFVSLRPSLLHRIFDRLRSENGAVFITAMSTDVPFLDMLADNDSPIRYSEWFVDGKPSRMFLDDPDMWERWHVQPLVDYQRHVYDNIDGAVAVLYEYFCGLNHVLPPEKVAYGGLPVDLSRFEPNFPADDIQTVKFFLGRDRTRKLQKGSDYLEDAARIVVDRHPALADLTIVENRPFDEFVGLLRDSHVVLDQIYSYTPATTALMAMAYGLTTVSGAEPDYYDFIGEHENRPIINAPVCFDALVETLDDIVTHRDEISVRGRASRRFVEKHNDCEVVARSFLDFWTSKLH